MLARHELSRFFSKNLKNNFAKLHKYLWDAYIFHLQSSSKHCCHSDKWAKVNVKHFMPIKIERKKDKKFKAGQPK